MRRVPYNNLSEAFLNLNDDRYYNYIIDSQNEFQIKASDFKQKVKQTLQFMRDNGLGAGDELIFQIKDCLEFTCAFWACILGKIIPVPYNYLETERDQSKLLKVVKTLNKPHILTDSEEYERIQTYVKNNNTELYERICDKIILISNRNENGYIDDIKIDIPNERDTAFIQFSSGSTSDPKGIVITHQNVIESISAVMDSVHLSEKDIYLSWLPLSHNFGLVGTYITPLLGGCEFNIMSSDLFIKNPLIWIKKLSEHKATISASPNFGLKRVCQFASGKKCENVDLSSLRMIYDGAEHISYEDSWEFTRLMSAYGMKETVVTPSYGLTEATLTVSVPKMERGIIEIFANRDHVNVGDKVIEQQKTDSNSICFIDVGECIDCITPKIVDDDGNELEEGVIGNLFIKGNVLFKGYYNNKALTEKVIDSEGWFNTGDLGFLRKGRLVITGRAKDVVIINGENYYLSDIEQTCLNAGKGIFNKVAVCEIIDSKTSKSKLACFVEMQANPDELNDISIKIRKYVLKEIRLAISWLIPVTSIPQTSSGKVQRFPLIEQFKNGEYDKFINN